MIRGFQFMPGIPAAGHVTTGGYWHPGALDTCPRCVTTTFNSTPQATPTRGANLMTNTTQEHDCELADRPDPNACQFEAVTADFDGSTVGVMCLAPATHFPTIDDAYALHLRQTGVTGEEVDPAVLPTCDIHYAQLLTDIAEQPADDPHRIWIAAEPRTLVIGYTKVVRPAPGEGFGYVPMADGYRPGAAQHELVVTVPLSPDLQPYRIAELVFIATNAPDLAEGSPEELIRLAIEDTGYNGMEAHFSLSVGDTVAVQGGPRFACEKSGWTEVAR